MEQFVLEKIDSEVNYHYTRYDVIERFPKEFKKNWLKSTDFRFLTIWVITFLITMATESYFASTLDEQVAIVDAQQIQEKYVRILDLEQYYDSVGDIFTSGERSKGTHLYGVADNIENHSANIDQDNLLNENIKHSTAAGHSNVDVYQENSYAQNSGRNDGFKKGKKSKTPDVSTMGILGYLSSDDNISNHQGIDDIVGVDNEGIFTVLDEMEISNASANGSEGENIAQINRNEYQMTESKIKRASIQGAEATLFPTRRSVSKVITKNVDWEEIPTTQQSMSTKRIKSGNGSVRTPDDISRILTSHNRAIQDCYKKALKENQNLKGKIVVRFSVTPDGYVNDVKIIYSSLEDEEMENCIIKKISRWNDFGFCNPELGISYYKQTYVFGY